MENLEKENNESVAVLNENAVYGLPAIALRGKVVFPNVITAVDVGRIKSLNAVHAALNGDKLIFAVSQKSVDVDSPSVGDLYTVGTVCKVGNLTKIGNDAFKLTLEGLYRAQITSSKEGEEYFCFNVERLETVCDDELIKEAYFISARDRYKETIELLPRVSRDALNNVFKQNDAETFINHACFVIPFKEAKKQKIIEINNLNDRIYAFIELLAEEKEIIKIERAIAEKVKANVDKNQKEFYLREQIKAIHEELGDDVNEIENLREQIIAKNMGKEREEKVLSELKRMSKMMPSSPDYTVLRSYIDWVLDVPFTEESEDTEKISDLRKVLEADHFGLEKVKERIIEYLSVLKLTKSLKGPILCLVGPPGVGKTSVAKSVARALNRKLVRMSLGGVKDEAEIRGHRKTYIGAMPGRIIFGMKESGSINPVFLLDEIDKLSSDLRGDPASALLEVLDPEQNSTFRDRYLEIPYDLSKVMFITTANSVDTIPAPLLDRMEVIDIAGYTEEEKIQIAKRYLVPKAIKANGLTDNSVKFVDGGIREIINGYTGEAGVRKLEQQINSVVRKIATKVAEEGEGDKITIDKKAVSSYLGANKYSKDQTLEKNQVGSATGLAWTSIGGTTLTIEVAIMKGKGNLLLTGKLGDVMQESAKTAISYIRANAEEYGIDCAVFENNDVHIHVPEGATPKDGPSAGITIATALLSAFTNKKVRRNIAMTGEITLRGNVLAIGGLKEKSLAGFRLGVKKIIIPKSNVKDLEEIPKEISSKLEFIAVENVKEVFKIAIEG